MAWPSRRIPTFVARTAPAPMCHRTHLPQHYAHFRGNKRRRLGGVSDELGRRTTATFARDDDEHAREEAQ